MRKKAIILFLKNKANFLSISCEYWNTWNSTWWRGV